LLASLARPALAQTAISAGVFVGTGCQNGRDCSGRIVGQVVAVDLSDRFTVRARGFALNIADRTVVTEGVSIYQSDIARRMLLGEFVVHLRHQQRVRPLFGVSVGARRDSTTIVCVPGPCSSAFGAGASSQVTDGSPRTHASVGVIAGMGFALNDYLSLEASVGMHDPFREDGRTTAAAVFATWRLWKSR
jgi:hypothetical protein